MQIKIISILLIFIIFLSYNNCFATDEVDVSQDFMKYNAIVRNNSHDESMTVRGFESLLEIIKKNPGSAEAFYGLGAFKDFNVNEIVFGKLNYNVSDLSIEKDTAEIIVYSNLVINAEIEEEKIKEIKEKLKSQLLLLSQLENKNDYSALASFVLIFYENNAKKYYELFKRYYPESKGIPLVELIFMNSEFYNNEKYSEDIKELKILAKKYSKLKTPYGWSTDVHFYVEMVYCYIKLKDYENARSYFEKIETMAPNYPFLEDLRTQIILHEKGVIKTIDEIHEELRARDKAKQKNK